MRSGKTGALLKSNGLLTRSHLKAQSSKLKVHEPGGGEFLLRNRASKLKATKAQSSRESSINLPLSEMVRGPVLLPGSQGGGCT